MLGFCDRQPKLFLKEAVLLTPQCIVCSQGSIEAKFLRRIQLFLQEFHHFQENCPYKDFSLFAERRKVDEGTQIEVAFEAIQAISTLEINSSIKRSLAY